MKKNSPKIFKKITKKKPITSLITKHSPTKTKTANLTIISKKNQQLKTLAQAYKQLGAVLESLTK